VVVGKRDGDVDTGFHHLLVEGRDIIRVGKWYYDDKIAGLNISLVALLRASATDAPSDLNLLSALTVLVGSAARNFDKTVLGLDCRGQLDHGSPSTQLPPSPFACRHNINWTSDDSPE